MQSKLWLFPWLGSHLRKKAQTAKARVGLRLRYHTANRAQSPNNVCFYAVTIFFKVGLGFSYILGLKWVRLLFKKCKRQLFIYFFSKFDKVIYIHTQSLTCQTTTKQDLSILLETRPQNGSNFISHDLSFLYFLARYQNLTELLRYMTTIFTNTYSNYV